MNTTTLEAPSATSERTFPVARLRQEFPVLAQEVNGRQLVYLDNAATSQKPDCVIESVADFYRRDNANVHRGVHELSERATRRFEGAREAVRRFINAASVREVVFTRGTTEGINLVAQSFLRPRIGAGDEILITGLEHHSNIVPWQLVCEQTGATLKVAEIDGRGDVRMDKFKRLLTPRTRLAAISHVSNALGTVNPVSDMIRAAREAGVPVLLDGAQALPHMAVDVQALDCDFYALSAHKMFGPTGIGALYGKEALLDAMPPWQGGGDMIAMVSFEKTRYNELPFKFEAGTPNIAGAIGLGRAVEFLETVGMDNIHKHESELVSYALQRLGDLPGLRLIGEPAVRAGVISFVIDGIHPHDLGTIVNSEGVAIRTGHHCAMPVMDHFAVPATARASFALYNTTREVDLLVAALAKAQEVLG